MYEQANTLNTLLGAVSTHAFIYRSHAAMKKFSFSNVRIMRANPHSLPNPPLLGRGLRLRRSARVRASRKETDKPNPTSFGGPRTRVAAVAQNKFTIKHVPAEENPEEIGTRKLGSYIFSGGKRSGAE
ncbi:hypothetical protein EVAR_60786_1 [Eumeta japonica]|uniref:Uncharacterized protein n=1 Tax=Eumeta variegata TaxID=151549 RepID=A0A4C1ZQE9_EUMVA|nr:hypothetical protein EVAR_60786_1 [Eumeta japonica]